MTAAVGGHVRGGTGDAVSPVLCAVPSAQGWSRIDPHPAACYHAPMPRKPTPPKRAASQRAAPPAQAPPAGRPSSLVDTRIIYCGDCLDQLRKLPAHCVDLVYIDPPFNSNRNYEVFWGETKEKRAFEDRHASTAAYIDYMRPRCVELARVLKPTGSFYYHCDGRARNRASQMVQRSSGPGRPRRRPGARDSHSAMRDEVTQ
jgi:hypothetical protein